MRPKEPHATFSLRLPRDLGRQIQQRSDAVRMSMNAWMLRAIDLALGSEVISSPTGLTTINRSDIERRALLAYHRRASQRARQGVTQESGLCEVQEVGGNAYAKLSNVSGVLAVYRVHRDGKLQSLQEWPSELN